MYKFVHETEKEEFSEESDEHFTAKEHELPNDLTEEPSNLSVSDNEVSEDESNRNNNDCLNIEVFHSKLGEDIVKKDFKFTCPLCSFRSQRESHYERHMNLHKTSSTIYRCDECNFSTLRFTHLRRHQVSHSAKTMMCESCNYSTDDAKLLVRHVRLKHKVRLINISKRSLPYCSRSC